MEGRRPRVLLADERESVLDAVRRLLTAEFDIVGVVRDGHAFVALTLLLDPDVVVVDIAMQGCNGIEATRVLRSRGYAGRIVFLTLHQDPSLAETALSAGGSGYVLKARASTELPVAIREAMADRLYVSPSIGEYIARG